MGKLVFGMSQSLDGYVDDVAGTLVMPRPDATLFRHFTERARGLAGSLYGRRIYELMRYWDEDRPEWQTDDHDFAAAWRALPKWVVSRSLKSVGPNATLVGDDLETFVRRLKADVEGDIEVEGPELAGTLTDLGLIDAYQLYFRPFVLGLGKPYFIRARSPLRLVGSERIGDDTVRLTYVPAGSQSSPPDLKSEGKSA
ncbi:MAG TPA: dihydrofolate reductase family protein [Oscillatoriaceae cyanobacterium]